MTTIILLIVLGILLFVIEFLLVPGVTIAGIGGLALTTFGVYKAFNDFGSETGLWVLLGTLALSAFVIAMSLRAGTWRKFMLNTNMVGNVDHSLTEEEVKVGDEGETLTRLAPMGKILVNALVREAKSLEGYIDEHRAVEVVSVEGSRISVKPSNRSAAAETQELKAESHKSKDKSQKSKAKKS